MSIEVPPDFEVERCSMIYADIKGSQQIGKEWIDAGEKPILEVPSVIVPDACNYLINPTHRLSSAIKVTRVEPFVLDSRLISATYQT